MTASPAAANHTVRWGVGADCATATRSASTTVNSIVRFVACADLSGDPLAGHPFDVQVAGPTRTATARVTTDDAGIARFAVQPTAPGDTTVTLCDPDGCVYGSTIITAEPEAAPPSEPEPTPTSVVAEPPPPPVVVVETTTTTIPAVVRPPGVATSSSTTTPATTASEVGATPAASETDGVPWWLVVVSAAIVLLGGILLARRVWPSPKPRGPSLDEPEGGVPTAPPRPPVTPASSRADTSAIPAGAAGVATGVHGVGDQLGDALDGGERDPEPAPGPAGGTTTVGDAHAEPTCHHLSITLPPRWGPLPELYHVEGDGLEQMAQALREIEDTLKEAYWTRETQNVVEDLPRGQADAIKRGFGAPPSSPPASEVSADALRARIDQALATLARAQNPTIRAGSTQSLWHPVGAMVRLDPCHPADVGLPVLVRVADTITSRAHDDRAQVARVRFEDVDIAVHGPRRGEKRGERSFPLRADGTIRGGVWPIGHYGAVCVHAEIVCCQGRTHVAEHVLEIDGPFEEELRHQAELAHEQVNDQIEHVDRLVNVVLGLLQALSALFDTITAPAEVAADAASVPVVSGLISFVRYNAELIENLLQGTGGAGQIVWSSLKEAWSDANDRARTGSRKVAEQLPESGPAGEREVLSDRRPGG